MGDAAGSDDEVLMALRRAVRFVVARWRSLVIGMAGGAVLGACLALVLPPYYSAEASLVASSAVAEGDKSSTLSALSNLVGSSSGPSKELSPFDRLQIVLKSSGFAKSLLADETARSVLFPHRWDARAKRWTEPSGIFATIERWRGFEERPEPDEREALSALKSHLSIATDTSTGVVGISFTAKSRDAALYMLKLTVKRADDIVRRDYLEVAQSYTKYISEELGNITNVNSRQALLDQWNRYEQTVVMASVGLPFAELAIDPPHVPTSPSGPSVLIYSLIGVALGAVAALMFSMFFPQWSWNAKRARTSHPLRHPAKSLS